jgi:hypothetical protein
MFGVPLRKRRRELAHLELEPFIAMHQCIVKIERDCLTRHRPALIDRMFPADRSIGAGI